MRRRGTFERGWIAVLTIALITMTAGASRAGFPSAGTAGKPEPKKAVPPPPCNSCPCSPVEENENPKCPCDEAVAAEGDPVMLFNGAFIHERVDLVVPGVVPIQVIRRYDSASDYDSPLGYGWSLNYDVRLYEVGNEIVVRTRCGGQDRYKKPTGAEIAEPAAPERGSAPELERLASGLYVINYSGGSRAFFDDRGRLEFLQNPQGNRLHLTYESDLRRDMKGISPNAVSTTAPQVVARVYQLERIAEELLDRSADPPEFVVTGRYVDFTYDVNGRLETAESFDGRVVTYVQDTITGGTKGNLVQVDGLAGLVDVYGYSDSADIHNLTSLQEGQGGMGGSPPVAPVVLTYADDRVVTQTLGQTVWTFQYPNATERNVVRTVVDAAGTHNATTQYTFNASGFVTQRIDANGTKYEYVRTPAPPPAEPTPADTFVDQIKISKSNGSGGFDLVRTIHRGYAGDRIGSRSIEVESGVTRTESWEYEGQWLKAHQWVESDQPDRIFRTEYTFYRNGLREGEEGYSAGDPITNIYEIKRATAASGGVATAFEKTELVYDEFGRLVRIVPPALATNPDSFAIVRTYHPLSDTNIGTRGMLAEIHLEIAGPTVLPQLARSFSYDARGFLDTLLDAREHTTSYDWDDRGRVTRIAQLISAGPPEVFEETLFTYGAPNAAQPDNAQPGRHLVKIDRGQAGSTERQVQRLLWDARGFLTAIERKNGSSFERFASYGYDSDGNRLRALDGRGELHTWTYDDLGRALTMSDHALLWNGTGSPPAALHTTQYEYDVFGNRTKVIDAKGRVTDFTYDGFDRLLSVTQQGNGDTPNLAEPLVTAFEYDAANNVITVTDPKGQVTTHGYDLLSRLRSVQQPGLQTVTYDYDARSRLSKVLNARGQALLYGYFPFGGLKEVVYDLDDDGSPSGDRIVSYTYDDNGNLLTASDNMAGGLLETFTYDVLDRVDTVTAHYISGAPVLDSDYDAFGQRIALNLVEGTTTLRHQWAYGAMGRLVAACLPQDATASDACEAGGPTQTLGFSPLANDRLDALTHGNGLVTNFDYHEYGPIEQIEVGSSAFPLKLVYGYDALRNVTSIAETRNGSALGSSFGYDYDAVYRLTGATYPSGIDIPAPSESFGYDAAGNRDDDPESATPWAYDTSNRLTASPGFPARCYDADGNQTSTRSAGDCSTGTLVESFSWDATNRLTAYENEDTNAEASYAYDPFGRRVKKAVAGGATTYYLWDGDRLLAEYDTSGVRTVRYAYAGGFAPLQFARIVSSTEEIYDVHTDHLDTPRMLTDSSGTAVWRASYEAYGAAKLDSGNTVTGFNVRFPGQYFDEESGLHQNRHRYYAPDLGRYVSADPIGQDAGVNLYAYVDGNPVNAADPLGLFAVIECTRCRGTAGPMECTVTEDGVLTSSFTTNEGTNDSSTTPGDPFGTNGPLPPGGYNVPNAFSPKFQRTLPSPTNTGKPGVVVTPSGTTRTGIRIHKGSFSQGCIVCGKGSRGTSTERSLTDLVDRHASTGGVVLFIDEKECCP